MNLRTILIVVALLAAASGAVYYAQRPAPTSPADQRVGQALVERSVAEKAATLRLSDQGKSVVLARQPDGSWHVTTYHDLPADFSKLSGFIANLTDAKLQRLVTSSAERISRLEFKDTKIELLDSSGKELFSVTLGKNPDTGGGRFIRFGIEQKAFLASLNAWLDTDSKNWANAELLNLKPEDIARVEIPFPADSGGTVTVSRAKKDDLWAADKTPSGQKVKADRISAVLGSLGNLRFSETAALDDAALATARTHTRTFTLTTFDSKTITVALSRKPEEKKPKPAATPAPKLDEKAAASTEPAKPAEPEFETIPAGPVFVSIAHSDATAAINGLMKKRAYQISDYTISNLPQKPDDLFEPAPPPPAPAPAATTPPPADPKKP